MIHIIDPSQYRAQDPVRPHRWELPNEQLRMAFLVAEKQKDGTYLVLKNRWARPGDPDIVSYQTLLALVEETLTRDNPYERTFRSGARDQEGRAFMTFSLDDSKHSPLARWLADHNVICPHADPFKQGASGGRLTFCFTPTTLFTRVDVRCACGAEVDLTDYDSI